MRDDPHPAPAFHALALVATVRAALGAARQIGARRDGADPSAQEPEAGVRADLAALCAELRAQAVRLRLRALMDVPAAPAGALTQSFLDRVLLDDTARTLALAHQKLLSLYPAVPEAVVEEARRLAATAADRAVDDRPDADLGRFADRLAGFGDALGESLV